VFSCDADPKVRDFIRSTCPPAGPIYEDMLTRDHSQLPPHAVYVCGFPCKAFSSLRRFASRLLREPTAKPFFETVKVLQARRPAFAVLENVMGIRAVESQVTRRLCAIPGYFVFVWPLDSVMFGDPHSRPRIYFLLVRQDVAVLSDVEALSQTIREAHAAVVVPVVDHVADRMLPLSSPLVQDFLAGRRRQVPCAT
jgi:site-specific DNA-cytosine methylase